MKLFKFLLLATLVSFSLAKININTATKDEFMLLPSIGKNKTQVIIEYRKNNKFNSIDEIKNIKGIGEKRFETIKDDLSISGKTDTTNLKSLIKQKKEKITQKADKKVKNTKDKINKTIK